MKSKRELTGKWYIKKCFLGFKIMVEVIVHHESFYPEISSTTKYTKATSADLILLDIHIL